jgi:hypothetical protein
MRRVVISLSIVAFMLWMTVGSAFAARGCPTNHESSQMTMAANTIIAR